MVGGTKVKMYGLKIQLVELTWDRDAVELSNVMEIQFLFVFECPL